MRPLRAIISRYGAYIVENNSARTLPTIPSNVNNISFKECILRIFRNHIARLFPFLWCPLCFFSCGKWMQKNIVTVPLWPQITERWGMYWVIEIASETKPTLDVSNQQPATSNVCNGNTSIAIVLSLLHTKPFIVSIHHHTMSSNGNNGSNHSSNMYNILYVCGSMRSLPVFISNTPYSLVCLCVCSQQCESQCLCMELVGFRLFVSKCSSTEPSCVYGICSVVSLLHTISNVHSTCYCCWTVIWFGR